MGVRGEKSQEAKRRGRWGAETCMRDREGCRRGPIPRSPGTMGQGQSSLSHHTSWDVLACCIWRAEGGGASCLLRLLTAYALAWPWGGHTHCLAGASRDWQGATARTLLGGLQVTQAALFSTRRTSHFERDIVSPSLVIHWQRRALPMPKGHPAPKASTHPRTDCLYRNEKIR